MSHKGATRSGVQSLDRAVAILNTFAPERPELGMSEIARRVQLTTSTTHRLLASLQAHGLVRQVADRRYALGPQLLQLAHVADVRGNLRHVARPVMERLRDETGETVGLHSMRADFQRTVIDQAESRHPLRRTYTDLGSGIPLHQGAPGKVLLAHLPRDARERVLSQPLAAATAHTITDPDRLRAEIERIRREGHALSFEERVDGIHTVAVPLHDHTGSVIASVSVTGPASRVTRERLEALAPLARRAGDELSAQLGSVEQHQAS